ncbi:hypothetical protein [Glycomyces sp. YM15]|uniref:hypothetical protein n=1 Tax=Glycomyces sp. YM15 TaxID=2800446 RepID=UPI0019664D30|nr:hypothetical protein [Glycomyces sp. YM15]
MIVLVSMVVLVLVLMCMVVVLMRLVASFPLLYLLPSLALLTLLRLGSGPSAFTWPRAVPAGDGRYCLPSLRQWCGLPVVFRVDAGGGFASRGSLAVPRDPSCSRAGLRARRCRDGVVLAMDVLVLPGPSPVMLGLASPLTLAGRARIAGAPVWGAAFWLG